MSTQNTTKLIPIDRAINTIYTYNVYDLSSYLFLDYEWNYHIFKIFGAFR